MVLFAFKRNPTCLRCVRRVFEVSTEVFLKDFLSFYKERDFVFPFGLYIILKKSWDTSLAHARSAQREATCGSCSIVPGARVPNGTRVSDGCVCSKFLFPTYVLTLSISI